MKSANMAKGKLNDDTKKKSEDSKENAKKDKIYNYNTIFLLVCLIGIGLGLLFQQMSQNGILGIISGGGDVRINQSVKENLRIKQYCVYPSRLEAPNGVLKHVHLVLKRVGYQLTSNETPWELLWAFEYPFTDLAPHLYNLKPYQKVNHIPGISYIVNKVDLATAGMESMPKAFRLPEDREEFEEYASQNKDSMFLEKNNNHRGVVLKNVSDIDFGGKKFVQEYVRRPFLVDGHGFDIGVYVAITSVNPLRVYWYKGDVLFRFCSQPYHPFDPRDLDKYVVGDNYMPTWKVPSLAKYFNSFGYGMKDSFDTYVKSQNKDPSIIWDGVHKAITEVFLKQEKHLINALKRYKSGSFFEMVRVDLVVDEDLKVYLLEANMSPNLSSAHFPNNQLLYEQVVFNLLSLVGVSNPDAGYRSSDYLEQKAAQDMVSASKNIAVFSVACATTCAERCDAAPSCALCGYCLDDALRRDLYRAHREHLHRGDFRRLYPPTMVPNAPIQEQKLKDLTESNRAQYIWYQGKCDVDVTWCS